MPERRARARRWGGAVRVALGVAVVVGVAAGCGGGSDVSSRQAGPEPEPSTETAPVDSTGSGVQVVRYQGIELSVPAGWPVHDLAAVPSTCVRFDVHAVYLGSPSPDMVCPARAIGRADAVLVEPSSTSAASAGGASDQVAATEVNGLAVAIDSSRAVEHELVVAAPDAGVTVTVSFGETDVLAQEIVASMRAAPR